MTETARPSAEVDDLLALRLLPGLGPRLTAALLERFGTARAVLRATPAELASVPRIGPRLAESISRALQTVDVPGEWERMAKHGVRLLVLGQPGYPPSVAEIPTPPQLLYVRGSVEPADRKAVAIVGARECTGYGKRVAERLAGDLVRAGYTIVSGLARGIDGAAHRAALKANGRTLAVLAGGLSRIYPPEHKDLADEVAARGALLSEAVMGMEPMAEMFPARNRIISGLSKGIVLVEAAQRSGALITARWAGEQGRTVFAVPGPIDSLASAGTNGLLRQGAILVRGVEDILEELEGVAPDAAPAVAQTTPPGLDETQQRIWDCLGNGARHVDDLAEHLGLATPQLVHVLLPLEMKKVIRRLPGNQYERC